jgi:tyrosine-protein kinase Etk/Wzc
MATINQKNNSDFQVSFSDIKYICKRSKGTIKIGTLICCILAIFYTLTRPVQYIAQASFREKAKSQTGLSPNSQSGISVMLLSGNTNNSEAISMMKSRTLLARLVKKMGLQAHVDKRTTHFPTLKTIKDNLVVELALFKGKQGPILSDHQPEIIVENVNYDGESPLQIKLRILSDDTFQILRAQDTDNTTGKLGQPFTFQNATMTLIRRSPEAIDYQEYNLTIEPINTVVERLTKKNPHPTR